MENALQSKTLNILYSFLLNMKKGELTINYIVVLILALLVLVIVAIIFRDQITNFLNSLNAVSEPISGDQLSKTTEELLK
jgi:predicted PurR-regulated permease PerM